MLPPHVQVVEQGVALEHEAHPAALGRHVGAVGAVDQDAPAVGVLQAGQQAQHRRLARARRPQQGGHAAGGRVEADVVHRRRRVPGEPLGQPLDLQAALRPPGPRRRWARCRAAVTGRPPATAASPRDGQRLGQRHHRPHHQRHRRACGQAIFRHRRGGQLIQAAQPAPGLGRGGAGDHRRRRVGGEPAIQQAARRCPPARRSPSAPRWSARPGSGRRSPGRRPRRRAPTAPRTPEARPRWVTGIPASAGAATAELTPGMTSNGMPASTSASASSPPRPSTNGSPPFRRTTSWPAAGLADHQAVDRLLGHRRPAGALAHVEPAGLGRQRPQLGPRQGVEQHQVGLAQPPVRPHRQQVGVAGAGTHQGHAPAS